MNLEESGKILAVIKKIYPYAYKNFSDKEKRDLLSLWAEMFADADYNLVNAAVKTYIATNTSDFAPTIGKINELMRKLTQREQITEQEAVNQILKACKNSIYHADEEFNKLSPVMQRLAGSPDQLKAWAMLDADEVQTVVASNLMRSYRVIAEREAITQALPMSIRKTICDITDKLALESSGRLYRVLLDKGSG